MVTPRFDARPRRLPGFSSKRGQIWCGRGLPGAVCPGCCRLYRRCFRGGRRMSSPPQGAPAGRTLTSARVPWSRQGLTVAGRVIGKAFITPSCRSGKRSTLFRGRATPRLARAKKAEEENLCRETRKGRKNHPRAMSYLNDSWRRCSIRTPGSASPLHVCGVRFSPREIPALWL